VRSGLRALLLGLTLLLGLAGPSLAGPIAPDGVWQQFFYLDLGGIGLTGGCAPGALFDGACLPSSNANTGFADDPTWTFTSAVQTVFTVTDAGGPGETFVVLNNGTPLGVTPAPLAPDFSGAQFCEDPDVCVADPSNWSSLAFLLEPGAYDLDILLNDIANAADFGFFQLAQAATEPVPEPATLLLLGSGLGLGLLRKRWRARP
jgi:hypothetical protein